MCLASLTAKSLLDLELLCHLLSIISGRLIGKAPSLSVHQLQLHRRSCGAPLRLVLYYCRARQHTTMQLCTTAMIACHIR